MSTFKPEEIAALRAGGNGVSLTLSLRPLVDGAMWAQGMNLVILPLQAFAASFLAKWSQTQLPKPTDRNVDRIKEWIREVYESKRFYDSTMRELSADATSRQPLGSEVGMTVYLTKLIHHSILTPVPFSCTYAIWFVAVHLSRKKGRPTMY